MTTLPAVNYINDNARTQGEIKTALEDVRQFLEDLLGTTSTLPQITRNFLLNGGFRVEQRGTSFTAATTPYNNNDAALTLDRWVLLSDGNDVVDVTQDTSIIPTGAFASIALDVETANVKFGIAQILEAKDAKQLAGQKVSLSFEARTSGAISIDHLRAGVLSWTGTEDAPTLDLVSGSAWGAAGTDPTIIANWVFDNVPANLATLTTAFQKFEINGITVASGAKNVAVFIWSDDVTTTLAEILYIGNVQLELGDKATTFSRSPIADDLVRCSRYYQRAGAGIPGACFDTTSITFGFIFHPHMVKVPNEVLIDTSFTVVTTGSHSSSGASITASVSKDEQGARIRIDGFTSITAGHAGIVQTIADFIAFDVGF